MKKAKKTAGRFFLGLKKNSKGNEQLLSPLNNDTRASGPASIANTSISQTPEIGDPGIQGKIPAASTRTDGTPKQKVEAESAAQRHPPESASGIVLSLGTLIIDATAAPPNRFVSEMRATITEFKDHYERFATYNRQFLVLDDDFQSAFKKAEDGGNVREAAKVFAEGIKSAVQTIEQKHTHNNTKWVYKVGNFLKALYPVSRLALDLTSAISEVYRDLSLLNTGGIFFAIERRGGGTWNHFAGIRYSHCAHKQIIDNEVGRGEDFLSYLRRVEFQAAILADNPNYDLDLESTQKLVNEKSTDLMTAIIKFFDSALIYFSHNFFGSILSVPLISS
jgi:hypothetical protein